MKGIYEEVNSKGVGAWAWEVREAKQRCFVTEGDFGLSPQGLVETVHVSPLSCPDHESRASFVRIQSRGAPYSEGPIPHLMLCFPHLEFSIIFEQVFLLHQAVQIM